MLQKLLDEVKACSEFLGLNVEEVEVKKLRSGGGTGTCKIGARRVLLPTIKKDQNSRKLVMACLLNFVDDVVLIGF